MDCSPLGSSVHGILQARIVEWVAMCCSRGSSQPRDRTRVFCTGRQILYHWGTWEAGALKQLNPHLAPPQKKTREETPRSQCACPLRIIGNALETNTRSWAEETSPVLAFKAPQMFRCARSTSNASTGKPGFRGKTVPVALDSSKLLPGDQLFHFISSLMTGVAQLYVKQQGTQFCEQTSLVHIWQVFLLSSEVMKPL